MRKPVLNLPSEAALELLQLTYTWHFNLSAKTSERDFWRTVALFSSCHQCVRHALSGEFSSPRLHLESKCRQVNTSLSFQTAKSRQHRAGLGMLRSWEGSRHCQQLPRAGHFFQPGELLRQARLVGMSRRAGHAEGSWDLGRVPAAKCLLPPNEVALRSCYQEVRSWST